MPRRAQPWQRSDRPGWRVWLNGKQVFLGHDKAEAFRAWHRLLSLEAPAQPNKLTVELLVDRYLIEIKPRLAKDTFKNKRLALQRWIDHYGSMRAEELRPFHVTAWLNSQATWNQSSKHSFAAVVKTWSAWCVQEGYLEVDRLRSVRVPGGSPRKAAASGDLERLIAATDDPTFRDFLVILGDTGCRPGEIRSLEASGIDFKTSTAIVRGKRGSRVVGLTRRSVAILRPKVKEWPNGPVLRNDQGGPWTVTTLKRRFDKAAALAGVSHFVPYHARHDLPRRMVKAGINELLIRDQMGHVNLRMLSDVYFHSEASMLADAVELAASPPAKPARVRRASRRGKRPPRRSRVRGGKGVGRQPIGKAKD